MMREVSSRRVERKGFWELTPEAFHRLLNWLDEGASSDGQKYLEMRRRLVAYFDRKNCVRPDELADETLTRVARRLEEEAGAIEGDAPARYCYIVARFVFMEHLRETQKDDALAHELRRQSQRGNDPAMSATDDERKIKEQRLHCLEQCLSKLESASREIIARWCILAEQRRARLPQPDLVTGQQVMAEHQREHARLAPREVDVLPGHLEHRLNPPAHAAS